MRKHTPKLCFTACCFCVAPQNCICTLAAAFFCLSLSLKNLFYSRRLWAPTHSVETKILVRLLFGIYFWREIMVRATANSEQRNCLRQGLAGFHDALCQLNYDSKWLIYLHISRLQKNRFFIEMVHQKLVFLAWWFLKWLSKCMTVFLSFYTI